MTILVLNLTRPVSVISVLFSYRSISHLSPRLIHLEFFSFNLKNCKELFSSFLRNNSHIQFIVMKSLFLCRLSVRVRYIYKIGVSNYTLLYWNPFKILLNTFLSLNNLEPESKYQWDDMRRNTTVSSPVWCKEVGFDRWTIRTGHLSWWVSRPSDFFFLLSTRKGKDLFRISGTVGLGLLHKIGLSTSSKVIVDNKERTSKQCFDQNETRESLWSWSGYRGEGVSRYRIRVPQGVDLSLCDCSWCISYHVLDGPFKIVLPVSIPY